MMKLDCFALNADPPEIAPARASRKWMDAFPDRHAYRCLPLSIANAYSWDILCPAALAIEWNGGMRTEDMTFHALEAMPGVKPVSAFAGLISRAGLSPSIPTTSFAPTTSGIFVPLVLSTRPRMAVAR